MAQDRVTLTVPARGEYAKTVRMTAAALVSRMDMSYDDVDDVRMAAEEAFIFAADTLSEDDSVQMTFYVEDGRISIEVILGDEPGVPDDEVERRTSYATFILQSVCDEYELSTDAQGVRSLKLLKCAGVVDAS